MYKNVHYIAFKKFASSMDIRDGNIFSSFYKVKEQAVQAVQSVQSSPTSWPESHLNDLPLPFYFSQGDTYTTSCINWPVR